MCLMPHSAMIEFKSVLVFEHCVKHTLPASVIIMVFLNKAYSYMYVRMNFNHIPCTFMYTFTKCCVIRMCMCVRVFDRFYEWDRKTSHKQPYFIFFTNCSPTEEMKETSAESAECEEEEEVGVVSGAVGGGGGAVSSRGHEELDLDQVKGRMLTMAGLFEIWRNDLEVCVLE